MINTSIYWILESPDGQRTLWALCTKIHQTPAEEVTEETENCVEAALVHKGYAQGHHSSPSQKLQTRAKEVEVEETVVAAKLKQEEAEKKAADKRCADSKTWNKPANVKKLTRPAGWRGGGMRLIKAAATMKPAVEKKSTEEKNLPQNKSILYILLRHTSPIKNT